MSAPLSPIWPAVDAAAADHQVADRARTGGGAGRPLGNGLDDLTVGLTALHGEVIQSRLEFLELVQTGVTGLREENREVRRRQDRMISDLSETRGELRQLLDLARILRPLAELQRPADEPGSPPLV
ncbi:hypothetical protein AB0E82_19675 [Streptomyces anulatus]|uniref:hypothetical protein n=1 Tax=Streptomyces anulatus TaxID=1892 RepID=UPI0033EC94CD